MNSYSINTLERKKEDINRTAMSVAFLYINDVRLRSGFIYSENELASHYINEFKLGNLSLLSTVATSCKRFFNNGVLGTGSYVDPDDGVTKVADFGFVIRSRPEDVLSLTSDQRKKRVYPLTTLLVILGRAGHIAEINATAE